MQAGDQKHNFIRVALPSQTTNNTCDVVSQEFSERDRARSKYSTYGNGYLAEGVVLNLWCTV